MSDFIDRMIRAIKLDGSLYTEVAADRNALGQAIAVVAFSGLASGVGIVKDWTGYLVIMLITFIFWLVWSLIAYLIGTRVLPQPQTSKDYSGLLRAIGFALTPHILQIFAIVTNIMLFVTIATTLWTLSAIVIAIRQTFEYKTTFRAIWVVVISFVVQAFLILLLNHMVGGGVKPA